MTAESLALFRDKVGALAGELRAEQQQAAAIKLETSMSELDELLGAGGVWNVEGTGSLKALSAAVRVCTDSMRNLIRSGLAKHSAVLFRLQQMLLAHKRNSKRGGQIGGEEEGLVRCGQFEIELKDDTTDLKFAVFNPFGDLLVMGTNQGMFITFRYFPDGHMEVSGSLVFCVVLNDQSQVQETCSSLDLNEELLDAAFSSDGTSLAFISNRRCYFIKASDAQSSGDCHKMLWLTDPLVTQVHLCVLHVPLSVA